MDCIELERAPLSLAAWSRTARAEGLRLVPHAWTVDRPHGEDARVLRPYGLDDLLFGATALVGGPILVVAALWLA